MIPAALTVAASVLLAGAALPGVLVTAVAVLVLQASLSTPSLGWQRLTGAPDPVGAQVVALLAAIAADVVLVLDDRGDRVGPVVGVLALLVPAAFVQQVLRRDGRARLLASVSSSVTLAVLCVVPAVAIPLARVEAGRDGLVVGLAAVALATVVADLLDGRLLGLLAGTFAGVVAGLVAAVFVDLSWPRAAVVAAGTSLVSVASVRASRLAGRSARHAPLAVAVAPLALSLPVVYVLMSLLGA